MRSFLKRNPEPSALRVADNAEAIIAARDEEIEALRRDAVNKGTARNEEIVNLRAALMHARGDAADLRERLEFREATIEDLKDQLPPEVPAGMITVTREHLDMLAARAAALQQQVTGIRLAATEALRAMDAAAGEAVAADEPA
jgi:hypothetical protein